MASGTPEVASLRRALGLLEGLVAGGARQTIAEVAASAGLPLATAHRHVTTLMAAGFLTRLASGRYVAGPRLRSLLGHVDEKQQIAAIAAPVLHELAARVRGVVQLGTLENDMVTYRIKTGRGARGMFTRVGMQLEAYCSGIGKVLLAYLPDDERKSYLANGPFIALTERTITTAQALSEELARVREQGFATDEGEIAEDLACLAVPIHAPQGRVIAAISISRSALRQAPSARMTDLPFLRDAAVRIGELAAG